MDAHEYGYTSSNIGGSRVRLDETGNGHRDIHLRTKVIADPSSKRYVNITPFIEPTANVPYANHIPIGKKGWQEKSEGLVLLCVATVIFFDVALPSWEEAIQ